MFKIFNVFFVFCSFFTFIARVRLQFFSSIRVTSMECSYRSIAYLDKFFRRKKFFKSSDWLLKECTESAIFNLERKALITHLQNNTATGNFVHSCISLQFVYPKSFSSLTWNQSRIFLFLAKRVYAERNFKQFFA